MAGKTVLMELLRICLYNKQYGKKYCNTLILVNR